MSQSLMPFNLYGINADSLASELPPNIYNKGMNVIFDDGYVKKIRGYKTTYTPSVAPLHVMNIQTSTASYWLYAGTTKIYAEDGGTPGRPFDLTTSYSISTTVALRWTSTYFNGVPILNPKNAVPVYWDLNTTHDVAAIPGWVAGDSCDVIRAYKNYLIAINVTSGGLKNNNLIKWSDLAAAGSLPATWAPAASNAAGDKEFSTTDDKLVDGLQLGDLFIIYKQKSCYTMQEIGGQYVFAFDDLFTDFGALAEGCVVAYENKHAVLTQNDFVVHDGVTWVSKIDNRMRKFLFNNINPDYINDTFIHHDISRNEIMICYPSASSSIPDKALIWNYREDQWYPIRDIPDTYSIADGLYVGVYDDTWDSDSGIWDADSSTWDSSEASSTSDTLMIAGYTDTELFVLDNNLYFGDSVAYQSYIERDSIPIGNGDRFGLVAELWPDIRAVDGTEFTISVGFQKRPKDSISWKNFTYIVGTHDKVDIYGKGRFMSIKISETGDDGVEWKLGSRLMFDIRDGGKF